MTANERYKALQHQTVIGRYRFKWRDGNDTIVVTDRWQHDSGEHEVIVGLYKRRDDMTSFEHCQYIEALLWPRSTP